MMFLAFTLIVASATDHETIRLLRKGARVAGEKKRELHHVKDVKPCEENQVLFEYNPKRPDETKCERILPGFWGRRWEVRDLRVTESSLSWNKIKKGKVQKSKSVDLTDITHWEFSNEKKRVTLKRNNKKNDLVFEFYNPTLPNIVFDLVKDLKAGKKVDFVSRQDNVDFFYGKRFDKMRAEMRRNNEEIRRNREQPEHEEEKKASENSTPPVSNLEFETECPLPGHEEKKADSTDPVPDFGSFGPPPAKARSQPDMGLFCPAPPESVGQVGLPHFKRASTVWTPPPALFPDTKNVKLPTALCTDASKNMKFITHEKAYEFYTKHYSWSGNPQKFHEYVKARWGNEDCPKYSETRAFLEKKTKRPTLRMCTANVEASEI